jgi:hypothetical protein
MLIGGAIWTASLFPRLVSTAGARQAPHRSLHNSYRCLQQFDSGSMAWRSSGTSNDELVENMKRNGLLTSAKVATVNHEVL